MKLSEFRAQISDLGFEDDNIYNEYVNVIINALNRSLDIINTTDWTLYRMVHKAE